MGADARDCPLKRTPLFEAHAALGAKLVPFAGYEMPVQYALGVLKEHLWTRQHAGLFDVSHMGQARLIGPDHETTARALEALVPADILGLKPGQQRYSQLLNEGGGTVDDLMITRPADPSMDGTIQLVVNAGCKEKDYAHIRARLPRGIKLVVDADAALLALQGPAASAVLSGHLPGTAGLAFMTAKAFKYQGADDLFVSRSGYTGEDGYEISVPAERAGALWTDLLADDRVEPVGLGGRDSLRLEAGLCLYGHDLDETTSPVEAGLQWSIQKRRRSEGGYPGADRIQAELVNGPKRVRVGIRPDGRAPAREGTEILSARGDRVGVVTSGGFGPSVDGPIAMGYVTPGQAAIGTPLQLVVRGKALPAKVVALPFFPHRYRR